MIENSTNEYIGIYEANMLDDGINKICIDYNLKKDEFHFSVLKYSNVETNPVKKIMQYIYNWVR